MWSADTAPALALPSRLRTWHPPEVRKQDHYDMRGRTSPMTAPVKGPASYFPSIEKKYGRPIAEWKDLIRTSPLTKHMELVTWLKTEHGLGHGHANALVAHTLAESNGN
ncbi:hypothetical protein GCM10010251_02830 [Streptomyces aurantiogriseus]|uniref:DUF4287 domain-containing protein n=2 Tax=Streptomyces aurantiogriseus TaxID=66870 RepID=A0A918BTK1_9ACTN|nr:hypothetical protein GCM10010251_02830 [Streptomyces aurantiogriseus]